MGIEPTWKEIYYLVEPLSKKDKTFSAGDIIRFWENNLTILEREEVRDYFCALCEEDFPPPDEPYKILPPQIYYLPPLFVPYLSPPPPPQIMPPVPQLPPPTSPTYPDFLLPHFPFVIVPLLPQRVIEYLREELGVKDVSAQIIELESDVNFYQKELQQKITTLQLTWEYVWELEEKLEEAKLTPEIVEEIPITPETPGEEPGVFGPQIPEDTPFEEEWEEYDDYWEEQDKYNWHLIIIDLCEDLERFLDDVIYLGWMEDAEGNYWYQFKISGDRIELTGDEVYNWYQNTF